MALFTTILGSALLAAIANALVTAAISLALNLAIRALQKKPKSQTQALDFEQTVQRRLSTGVPLEVLVGQRIVAGVGYYDDAYGSNNEYGVAVTVYSAKPCAQFHKLYLDGEPVTLDGDPTTGERAVTSHFTGKNNAPRVFYRIFTGVNNAGLGEFLASKFPSAFDANDDFGDYCVGIITCRNTNDDLDEETGKNYIPFQGFPESKVELSGAFICDIRIPGADYADESTYVYTDNAALIDAQYDYGWYSGTGDGRALIVGNGYPIEIMDIDQITRQADNCDDKGYSCAGLIRSANSGDQEEIWKCFNADRVEHAASVFSVAEDHRTDQGIIDISGLPAAYVSAYDRDGYSTEVYNEIKTTYAEPEEFYAEKDLPIYSDPAWVTADNHIPRQMSLPLLYVTDKVQAGRLQKQEINITRSPGTCSVNDLPFSFIRYNVGSTITLTGTDVPAVNDKKWVIKGRGQTSRGDVSLQLAEYAGDAAFAFDTATETPTPDITPHVPRDWNDWFTPADYVPPRVIGDVDGIVDGTRSLADVVITGRGSLVSENDVQQQNIDAALNAVSGSAPAGGGGAFTATVSPGTAFGSTSTAGASVSTGGVTVTVSGGTGPFTYQWSKVSGDTFSITNPTSPSTGFTATPGAGNNLSAIYQCLVTDTSNGETRTISVNVQAYDTTSTGGGPGGGGFQEP